MKRSKKAFTLLEIMVCLALIVLAGAAIGVQGGNLFKYHQFRALSQTFVFDLNKWRVMAMTLDSDVTCTIYKEKNEYKVSWEPDAPIDTKGSSLTYPLKGVKEITLQGKRKESFQFILYSSGRVSSADLLTFSPGKKEKEVSIDLSYPAALIEGGYQSSFRSALQKSNPPPYPKKKEEKV